MTDLASPIVAVPWWAWLVFAIVVTASVVLDLVLHRGERALGRRAAIVWSLLWIAVSLLFAGCGNHAPREMALCRLRARGVPRLHGRQNPAFASRRGGEGGKTGAAVTSHAPLHEHARGHRFVVSEAGLWMATPLLLALLAIEGTDILFAVDSIAAVLAVTNSPFIVFSSNVFAILGLRALYVLLSDLVSNLRYLHVGLGGILLFVGGKMLTTDLFTVPQWASLAITVAILTAAIVPSLVSRRRRRLADATA